MGCHFLPQCIKVKSEREVAHSCPTLSYPLDCSLPGSSIHGIFQARVLEWVSIAFSTIANGYPLLPSFFPLAPNLLVLKRTHQLTCLLRGRTSQSKAFEQQGRKRWTMEALPYHRGPRILNCMCMTPSPPSLEVPVGKACMSYTLPSSRYHMGLRPE